MKKAIAMLLTAALSMTLLAGCGGDDGGSSVPESKSGNQGSKQESSPAGNEGQQGGAENAG